MVDFYTHGKGILPKNWLAIVNQYDIMAITQVCNMLLPQSDAPVRVILPLSLLCFISMIKRRLKSREKLQYCSSSKSLVSTKNQLKFLKPKKIIELTSLLPSVQHVIDDNKITHVVDVGSGIGHASRFIANANPLCCVLRIEAQSQLIQKANNIDASFDKMSTPANIHSTVCRLELNDNIASSFKTILQDVDNKNSTTFSDKNSRLLLLGLHPCGNLGSFMLKLFSEHHSCRSIVIVSCCYMFIDEDPEHLGGFPLSNYLQNKSVFQLSSNLKEQSCHNAEFYLTRFLEHLKDPTEITQHWRAVADVFLTKRDSKPSRTWYRFKKRSGNEDIISFINKNFAKINVDLLSTEEQKTAIELSQVCQSITWAYFLVYLVKLSLGVVGESLMLSDRLVFLLENGHKSSFEVLFDPKESSRNIGIISSKP